MISLGRKFGARRMSCSQYTNERINRINFIYIHFNLNGCQTDTDSSAHPLSPTHTHSYTCQPDFIVAPSAYKMWNESVFNLYTRKRENQIWNIKMTSSAEKQMQLFVRQQCRILSASICIEGSGSFFLVYVLAWWRAMAIGIVVLV